MRLLDQSINYHGICDFTAFLWVVESAKLVDLGENKLVSQKKLSSRGIFMYRTSGVVSSSGVALVGEGIIVTAISRISVTASGL